MSTNYDEKSKLWTNPDKPPLDHIDISNNQWIWDSLLKHGSRVAQINDDNGVKTTFSEIRLRSIRAAQNLLKRGFGPRQKFGFMSINSDHLAPIFLASIGLVCPIVPLLPILSKDEIVQILKKIQPPIMFCDSKLYDQLKEALNEVKFEIKIFLLDGHVDGVETVKSLFKETGEEDAFRPLDFDLDKDIFGIFSSSGTTGPSKCVCLSYTHHSFVPVKCAANAVLFSCDTIFWTVGCRPIFNSIYNGVIRVVSSKPFLPAVQLSIIEKYKVTDLFNTPFIMTACLKSDAIDKVNLSSVKRIIFYGGKLPYTLVTDIKRYFANAEQINDYGLTELGQVSFATIDIDHGKVHGGQLYYGCAVKIIDDDGNRCGPNVNGEICVKKQHHFIKYFNDPDATAAAVDKEGFFRTGDIGNFDNYGNLSVEDRKKNVMTVFYFESVLLPTKIEDLLIKVPGIKEVCVVGVELAIDAYLPAAVIVKDPNSNLNQRDIFNVVAENFANGLRLRGGVYFVDTLPKTHTGKLIRKKITEMTEKLFKTAKENDPDVRKYLAEIPDEYKRLISN